MLRWIAIKLFLILQKGCVLLNSLISWIFCIMGHRGTTAVVHTAWFSNFLLCFLYCQIILSYSQNNTLLFFIFITANVHILVFHIWKNYCTTTMVVSGWSLSHLESSHPTLRQASCVSARTVPHQQQQRHTYTHTFIKRCGCHVHTHVGRGTFTEPLLPCLSCYRNVSVMIKLLWCTAPSHTIGAPIYYTIFSINTPTPTVRPERQILPHPASAPTVHAHLFLTWHSYPRFRLTVGVRQ